MIPILAGLAAGSAHVIAGPDHLAALAPIAVDRPRRAAGLGFRWGLGHGLGVIVLGALGILARSWVDVDAVSAWSEFIVGFALVVMGLWAWRRATRVVIHAHAHDHGDEGHAHLHVHTTDEDHDSADAHRAHSHAAFFVGLLHGAAGTGHLLGVLPSLALPPVDAALYLGAYFIAAVASMAAFGVLLGVVAAKRAPETIRRIMFGAASTALVVGVVWIGQAWSGIA